MEERCTFSRALHLMRYGGKKMRCIDWGEYNHYLCVVHESLIGYEIDGTRWNLNDLLLGQESLSEQFLSAGYLMGSWVEVQ